MAENIVAELIKELEEHEATGAISYSLFVSLMSKVRALQ